MSAPAGGRLPIKAVIFDIGGILEPPFHYGDFEDFSRELARLVEPRA